MRLMMYEHAKAVKFILGKACKNSKKAWEKFTRADLNGLTILHHAASQGNVAAVEAILRSAPKARRKELARQQDNDGHGAPEQIFSVDLSPITCLPVVTELYAQC